MKQFSGLNQTLDDVIVWYQTQDLALTELKKRLTPNTLSHIFLPNHFIGLTTAEAEVEIENNRAELETVTAFLLIASLEAALKIDYYIRVSRKHKDPVAIIYRKIAKNKGAKKEVKKWMRVELEAELLEALKNALPERKEIIANFIGVLKFRHWVAHGRYFNLNYAFPSFDFEKIQAICETFDNNISLYNQEALYKYELI